MVIDLLVIARGLVDTPTKCCQWVARDSTNTLVTGWIDTLPKEGVSKYPRNILVRDGRQHANVLVGTIYEHASQWVHKHFTDDGRHSTIPTSLTVRHSMNMLALGW